MSAELKLWRYDPITGYWRVVQGPFASSENAAEYLSIFQKDEPNIRFKLSAKRPPFPKSYLDRKKNPIRKVRGGYQWGHHGHIYRSRIGAVRQAQAAHAAGFREKNPMQDTKPVKYRGYVIRFIRGDWYVDDKTGTIVACVWSKKDGKRWVDDAIKANETVPGA